MNVIFDKTTIIEEMQNCGLSFDDFIGTLKSGAYVYQFEGTFFILSPKTIELGGKGYIIKGQKEFEMMFLEDSFPQIFNGREDIFELNKSILKNCEFYTESLHLKYPTFFQKDDTITYKLCNSLCQEIAVNYQNLANDDLIEKIMLLLEVFRYNNGYSWSIRKVYGEYTSFYIPVINNDKRQIGIDIAYGSILEGESWETIVKGSKFSLTKVNWIRE